MKNIVEKPCDYIFRVLKFISNCINIHVDSEICSLLIAIFRLIFWIWKLREREIFMRKIGSKQCSLCIVAIIVLCLCVVLVACDADDVKNLFQPSDFTITFVLNNGEDNVVWRRGDEVPMPTFDGYKFLYWCADKDCENPASVDFEKVNLSDSIYLYAKWQKLLDFADLSFESYETMYDGLSHSLEVKNLPNFATVEYDVATEYTDAGVYVVTATVKADGYNDKVLSATLTINKAKLGEIVFPDKIVTWDGEPHGVYIETELPSGVDVSYDGNEQTDVGEYEVTAHFDVGNNYESIDDMKAILTVSEKTYAVTFVDYNGSVVKTVGHGKTLTDIPAPSAKDGYAASWDVQSFENVTSDMTVTAVYTPIVYSVIYETFGGSVSGDDTTFTIERGVALSNVTRDFYIFDGWYADRTFTNKITEIGKGRFGDITVYAKWTPIVYTAHFYIDGGNNSLDNVNDGETYKFTVESETLTLLNPAKAFFDFIGWFTDENFTTPITEISKGTHGDLNIYAKWSPTVYNINYVLNGGENADNPYSYVRSDTDVILNAPVRAHYEFLGWFDSANERIDRIASGVFGDVTLYAKWSASEYAISYFLFGGMQNVANPSTYTVEDDDMILASPVKTYYDFNGWYSDADFKNKVDKIKTENGENIELYAKWTAAEYKIEFVNADVETIFYTVESEDIVLPKAFRLGYTFVAWLENSEFSGDTVSIVKKGSFGDMKIYAKFSANEYRIEYDLQGGVNDISNPSVYTVEDETVTLSAPTRVHYTFGGWFEDGKLVETIDALRLCDIKLVAEWIADKYTITYNLNGGECNDALVTEYTVESADITLPILTKKGCAFCGWYDNAAFDDKSLNNIPSGSYGNINLYAKFSVVEYTISYDLQGGVNSISNPTKYTIEDQNIVLSAPSRECYTFDGWFENGTKVESVEVARCENVNLAAKWTAIEYSIAYDLDGGICDEELTVKYSVESDDIILPDLSKGGYKFVGWFIGEKKIEKIAKGSYGDLKILAKWSMATYTVEYVCDGNHDNPTELAVDEEYTLKDAEKTGYSFEGWHSDESLQTRVYTVISSGETVTLYAKFAPVTYTIAYDYSGGEGVENPSTYTVESEDIILNAASKSGFEFVGWFNGEEKIEVIKKGSFGDISLVAKWLEKSPFVVENGVVKAYSGDEKHVVVPETVGGEKITAIDENLLQNIANSVEIIEIQAKIETLPQSVFFNLTKLRILTLPSSIVEMPAKLLKDCVVLEEVTLPFVGNTKFVAEDFLCSKKTINTFSFIFGDIQDVTFGNLVQANSVRYDSDGTIEKNVLKGNYYIPKTLKKVVILNGDIFDFAFRECVGIEEIVLQGKGTTIRPQAFAKCSDLKRIEFAESYVNFGAACFAAIANPAEIIVQNATQKSAIDNLALDGITVKIANSVA